MPHKDPIKRAEYMKAYHAKWAAKNPHKLREYNMKYYYANKEKENIRCAEYARNNPGKRCASTNKRDAAKAQRTPLWADFNRIKQMYECTAQLSRKLDIPLQVDHIIPLRGKTVSGLHVHTNLAIVTKEYNFAKRNHFSEKLL